MLSFLPCVRRHRPGATRLKPLGAATLLLVSGHAFTQTPAGSTALSSDATPTGAALPTVTVTAPRESDTVTEGTGLYTSPAVQIGGKTPQSQRQVPQSVSVITQQRLAEQNLNTLDAALGQATGITVQNSLNRQATLFARGFLVNTAQVDGVTVALPTNNYGFDAPDLAIYDHVEVLRGSAGLLHGAGTPGAVVGLARKRPTAERQFQLATSYGSWRNARAVLDGSGPLNAEGTLRGRAVLVHEDREFFYDLAAHRKTQLYGVLEYRLSGGTRLTAGAVHQALDGVPLNGSNLPRYSDGSDLGLPRSTFLGAAWNREKGTLREVFAEVDHRFDNDWRLKVAATQSVSDTDAKIGFLLGAIDPVSKTGAFQRGNAVQAEVERKGLDAVLSGHVDAFGRRHEVVLGANTSLHRYDAEITNLYSTPYQPVDIFGYDPRAVPEPAMPSTTPGTNRQLTRQNGVFGTLRLKLADPVTVVVGARSSEWKFRQNNLKTGVLASEYRDSAVTPFAGLVVDLNRTWSAYASYADVFDVQNRFFFDGRQLPPTTGVNLETGLKGELLDGRLTASLAVFRIRRDNIAQRDTVNTGPTDCRGTYCYVTGGETESQGFEAEVNGSVRPGWNLFAGYTYNTTKYLADRMPNGLPSANQGQPLASYVPQHILRVWSSHQLAGDWRRWNLGVGVNAQSRYYRVLSGQMMEQRGYAVWNARVAYQLAPRWTASLQVNNLTDKRYYARLNLLDQGALYGEPRSFMLALRGAF